MPRPRPPPQKKATSNKNKPKKPQTSKPKEIGQQFSSRDRKDIWKFERRMQRRYVIKVYKIRKIMNG